MDWKKHWYRVGSHSASLDDLPTEPDELDALIISSRKRIEPWLSAVFQAEHLNVMLGSGFTTAVGYMAGAGATGMAKVKFGTKHDAAIDAHAETGAKVMNRSPANIEDQFRSALAGGSVGDRQCGGGKAEDGPGHADIGILGLLAKNRERHSSW